MGFLREHLLLTYTETDPDDIKLAFEVLVEEYAGGEKMYFQDWSRSKSGAGLIVRGTSKRRFYGMVVLNEDATGTIDYDSVTYSLGTPADLLACYTQSTLKAKCFEDSSFWNAQPLSGYMPRVVYEPDGTTRVTEFLMEEK